MSWLWGTDTFVLTEHRVSIFIFFFFLFPLAIFTFNLVAAFSAVVAGVTVSGISFTSSDAGPGNDGGVALIENSEDILFASCAFHNVSAGGDGGAFRVADSVNVTVADSVATGVHAVGRGGFVMADSGLTMVNTNVTGATAIRGGVAYLAGGASSSVDRSILSTCRAGFGGCIYADTTEGGDVVVSRVAIDAAVADLSGGGVFVNAGYVCVCVCVCLGVDKTNQGGGTSQSDSCHRFHVTHRYPQELGLDRHVDRRRHLKRGCRLCGWCRGGARGQPGRRRGNADGDDG